MLFKFNLIDIAVLFIFALFVLSGLYRGFIPSIMNLCGFFISWMVSFMLYPGVSAKLMDNKFFSSLKFYIEGAERIGSGEAFELSKLKVAEIGSEQLKSIIDNASLPIPFNKAVEQNVMNQVYSGKGLSTLGEYFDETIYGVMINIAAFVIVFLVVMVITTLISNAVSYAVKMPQLRHFDSTTGGFIAVIRAFFFMYVLFSLVPIVYILLPVTFITDMVASSATSRIFYIGSIILGSLI